MKYIFTDCFDTLIIRKEHPYQVMKRWAQCVGRLYPEIDTNELYSLRMRLIKDIKVDQVGISIVYKELYSFFKAFIENEEDFYKDIHSLELLCEESTASINSRVESFLREYKQKGLKIYCITDYHLPSADIAMILDHLDVDFIDGVFSSASYGQTKHEGGLYPYVLSTLNASPGDCMMIGDNKSSDIVNANNNGISAKFFSNTIHKSGIRIKNKFGVDNCSINKVGKDLWKHTDYYAEFTLVFFTFCVRLYQAASRRGFDKVVFLAREGLFLKQCFEVYQTICVPRNLRIKTDYLKCSRRAIHSVQREKCLPGFFRAISVNNYFLSIGFTKEEGRKMAIQIGIKDPDKVIDDFANSSVAKRIWDMFESAIEERLAENRSAFDEYVHAIKGDSNDLLLVDVGWIGRMQQGIDTMFDDISTVGYYIGIYQNLFEPPYVERHGLVFNKDENGKESCWFSIFRSNIQFYEQLLSAPHGSACFYRYKDGKPFVYERWDSEEELLYEEVIGDVQEKLISVFERICTYSFKGIENDCKANCQFNRSLALILLRSALLQSKKRLDFMERLIKGFSQNFQQQTTGMQFSVKAMDERMSSILLHPDRFVRYISKLGVVFDKKGINGLGRFLMRLFYGYTRIVARL